MVYCIKYRSKYCRFGSYRMVYLCDSPEKATTYSRLSDAKKKTQENLFMDACPIDKNELQIFEVTFSYTEKIVD